MNPATPHAPLSTDDMHKIHATSLAILEQTGMQLDHQDVRSRLRDAGALVDDSTQRVRFPPQMVAAALHQTPSEINLAGRDPAYDRLVNAQSPFIFRHATGLTMIFEPQANQCRKAVSQDQRTLSILCDALPHIDLAAPLTLQDTPPKTADLHATKILLECQRKHFMNLTMGAKNMRYQVEMQLAVRGTREAMCSRPLFHPIVCVISPLYLPEEDLDILLIAGEYGLPLKIPVLSMMGASAPATIAGTLALGNAEVIGSQTILQTLFPGTPSFYYFGPSIMEMKKGNSIYGSPENMLLESGLVQMGSDFYKLPTESMCFFSDGVVREQVMFQKGTRGLLSALAGANIIGGAGGLDGGMAACFPQLVIDSDIAGMLRALFSGFAVDSEALALDVVNRVGPRGHFLLDRHTLDQIHKHTPYAPSVFEWTNYVSWKMDPKELWERAQAQADQLMTAHEVPPLPADVLRELERIITAADRDIAG